MNYVPISRHICLRFVALRQDAQLKDAEKLINKIEAEFARVRATRQQKGANVSSSSILVDNGALMTADKLLEKLESLKTDTKEKVSFDLTHVHFEFLGRLSHFSNAHLLGCGGIC